jgi:hypothetical protein
MLRYGKIRPAPFFDHDEVAADLPHHFLASFFKSFGSFLAGNVGQPSHR